MTAPEHSPLFRNAVHAGVFLVFGLPMLLLARWDWIPNYNYWAAGFMALVTLFNFALLPRLKWGRLIRRENEHAYNGVLLYPAALGVCFLAFPAWAVLAAWAILSFGDSAAGVFGRALPKLALFWNKNKTFAGLFGFVLCGAAGACLSLRLLPCPLFLKADGAPEWPYVWTLALLAAVAGALAESLDTELDDNVRVPFASALAAVATAHFLSFSTRALPAATHVQPEVLIQALLANAILGAAVLALGFASVPATLLGMALGTLIYFYAHWQGFLLFTLFVALGSGLSKIGLARKRASGTAEAREGKRGITNVVANLLVPALCCVLYPALSGRASLLMAFAGALSAALADTASSEIGVLSSQRPYLLTTFKPVPHGTNGAVSLLGTFGACIASALLSAVACASGFVQIAAGRALSSIELICAGLVLFTAGIVGTFVDSLLGATLEDKFFGTNKSTVNFACTMAGALTAAAATELWMLFQ